MSPAAPALLSTSGGGSQDRGTPTSAMLAWIYPACARSTAAARGLAPIVPTSLRGRPRGAYAARSRRRYWSEDDPEDLEPFSLAEVNRELADSGGAEQSLYLERTVALAPEHPGRLIRVG